MLRDGTLTTNVDMVRWAHKNYEGTRVYWNGYDILESSKTRTVIPAPPWVLKHLPQVPFEARMTCTKDWSSVKFIAFDSPLMFSKTVEERITFLQETISPDNPYVKVINPILIFSMDHLQTLQQSGDAGLVMRKPQSKYMQPDSFFTLQERKEVDAVVISHSPLKFQEYVDGKITLIFCSPNGNKYIAMCSQHGLTQGMIATLHVADKNPYHYMSKEARITISEMAPFLLL